MAGRLFGTLCAATAAGAGPMDLSTSAIIEVQKLTPELLNRELTNPLTSDRLVGNTGRTQSTPCRPQSFSTGHTATPAA